MSVTTETNRTAELTTDGVETEFDFNMLIHNDSEVQVWYKVTGGNYALLTLNTDYTVSFVESGGTLTTIGDDSPYAAGLILIIRHLPLTQQTNWLYNDNHSEQQHQDDFDRAVMRDIQIQEELNRCPKLPTSSSTTGIVLPEPDANKILGWNAAGDNLENKTADALGLTAALDDLTDVDVGAPATGDIVRWNGSIWQKYADSNYLATQTIGIADNNLLEVDGTPNSGEYARFTANGLEGRTVAELGADGIMLADGSISFTGVVTIEGLGTGGRTDYDLKVGDTATPDYGMIQFGNAIIGRTSYKVGNIDLDGAILIQNIGGPVTSQIEFIWAESTGDTCRFAIPKSGVGNATYNPRSLLIAGPAPADTDFVKVSYWQGQGIFDNLACDTAGDGADLGVQNDLEVEGDIFCDSIKESTSGSGTTFSNNLILNSLTASRLISSNGSKVLTSVANLTSWIAGTTDRISVADDGDGTVTLDLDTNTKTLLGSFNGIFLEKLDFTISEAAGTVTGSLEKDSGGDLTQRFSDGYTTLDCTPAKTVNLTPYVGTDAVPKVAFVYVLQSDKTTIAASNSDWPAAEHIKIANLLLKSAATTGTDGGALVNRNWNDFAFGSDSQGHITHVENRIRQEPSQWNSGIALTLKNSAGAALTTGNSSTAVEIVTSEGTVYQLHKHTFPAFDMYTTATDDAHIVNQPTDEGGAYETTANLVTDVTHYVDGTAAGVAIGTNKYFNLVIWGVQNRSGEVSHVMCNLPTGQYTKSADATSDVDGTSVFDIPALFKGMGFLIARLTFRLIGGSQWTYIAQEDLRGQIPPISAGVSVTATDHALLANLDFASAGHTGFQAQGDVLDDLNTLGAAASDGQFIVATGAGAFAYEATTVVRTSLGLGADDSPQFAALQIAKDGNAYFTLQNLTDENNDGGAETRIIFEDHSNTALAQIQGSHDGTLDDTKGDLIFYTHTGSALTEALRLDSAQRMYIPSRLEFNVGTGEGTFIEQDGDGNLSLSGEGTGIKFLTGDENLALTLDINQDATFAADVTIGADLFVTDFVKDVLDINIATDEMLILRSTSTTGNPQIGFYQTSTLRANITFTDSSNRLRLLSVNGYVDLYSANAIALRLDNSQDATFYSQIFGRENVKILERAAAVGNTAAYGQLWVKNDTPCILMFTDDAGNNFTVDVTAA